MKNLSDYFYYTVLGVSKEEIMYINFGGIFLSITDISEVIKTLFYFVSIIATVVVIVKYLKEIQMMKKEEKKIENEIHFQEEHHEDLHHQHEDPEETKF